MRILICPLDWGLGHASRCIPIIERMLNANLTVMVASSGSALSLLQKRFPNLVFFELPSYGIRYPTKYASLNFLLFSPKVIYACIREYFLVSRIIKQHQIQILISDNRLACWSRQVPSFYLSHQLQFAFRQKWINQAAAWLHYFWYKNYDQIWIPDLPPPRSMAGKLAQAFRPITVRYLGLLSQLKKQNAQIKYEAIIILSGPEPQRSILEKIIRQQLQFITGEFLMVLGLPESTIQASSEGGLQVVNFLGPKELSKKIAQSKIVICRSGYSSIMDMIHLQQAAILIPTPGQPEQEYLAQYHAQNALFRIAKQDNFKLDQLLQALEKQQIPMPEPLTPKDYLGDVIADVFSLTQ